MKRNPITIVTGVLLLLIFVTLLFTFQVRQTEVAVVTTFDNPTRYIDTPGLKFKMPRPIQKVYKFDKRIQNFEDQFQETLTFDNYPLLVMIYVGWTISDPRAFFHVFPAGTAASAEGALEGLIRSAETAVVGKHPFSHFISTDQKQLKFVEIENEMLAAIRETAQAKYGVEVKFLGIKKLGLPEHVTQKVFDRMTA